MFVKDTSLSEVIYCFKGSGSVEDPAEKLLEKNFSRKRIVFTDTGVSFCAFFSCDILTRTQRAHTRLLYYTHM